MACINYLEEGNKEYGLLRSIRGTVGQVEEMVHCYKACEYLIKSVLKVVHPECTGLLESDKIGAVYDMIIPDLMLSPETATYFPILSNFYINTSNGLYAPVSADDVAVAHATLEETHYMVNNWHHERNNI